MLRFLAVAGLFVTLLASAPVHAESLSLAPSRYMNAVVNTASQEAFLRQIQTFAREHAFDIDVVQIPDPDTGLLTRVYLSTVDLEIIAANPFKVCVFRITFNEVKSVSPKQMQATLSQMAESLRQVDGVTESEAEPATSAQAGAPCS